MKRAEQILTLVGAWTLPLACTLITDIDRNKISGSTGGSGGSGGSDVMDASMAGQGGDGPADSGLPTDAGDVGDAGEPMASLLIELERLEPLASELVYEGWLLIGGAPVSTGRFGIRAGVTDYVFPVPVSYLDEAEAFVLSLEPAVDNDPAPAATKVLGGAFANRVAPLAISHPDALNTNFASAMGSFVLESFTTGADTGDHTSGIWFLDPEPDAGLGPSLILLALPAGWIYEGWVSSPTGGFVSAGRFTDVADADMDGPGPTAGSDGSPEFPGQDFINPSKDLTLGYTATISVEPDPDDGPLPFAIRPLSASITGAMRLVPQILSNQSATNNPTGRATLRAPGEAIPPDAGPDAGDAG